MKKIEKIIIFLLYFGINDLFLYKYGLRQEYISVYLLIIGFPLFVLSLIYIILNLKLGASQLKIIFFTLTILFFLVSIILNYLIDKNTLNVDRWSAMETAISSILHHKYAYAEIDHLNGRSSNLPGLILIGLPFYLIGNIGLLQSFSFLLFSYTIYKSPINEKAKLIGLLLLTLSISFLWEVYVKSDLMSNFIILLSFISLWYFKFKNDLTNKTSLAATVGSFLIFTRLVALIPLIILFFKPFIKLTVRKKIIFIISSVITLTLLSFLVLKDLPNLETFRLYNPFNLQNRQLPFLLSLIFIIIPIYFSFKINSFHSLIKISSILLTLPVLSSFLISMYKYGFNQIINSSAFDLSYFNIPLPFLILLLSIKWDKKQLE